MGLLAAVASLMLGTVSHEEFDWAKVALLCTSSVITAFLAALALGEPCPWTPDPRPQAPSTPDTRPQAPDTRSHAPSTPDTRSQAPGLKYPRLAASLLFC